MLKPFSWCCWLVVVGIATSAAAQESTKKNRNRPLAFALEVSAEATDNRDSAAVDEQSNIDLVVSPRVDGRLARPGTLLQFYYSPSFRYRSDPSPIQNEDELFHDLGLFLDHEFNSRISIDIRDYYNFTDDPLLVTGAGTVRQDGSYYLNRASALVSIRVQPRIIVDARVRNRVKRYDDNAAALNLDEDVTRGDVTLWYQLREDLAVLGQVEAGTYELDDTTALRDFDSVSAVIGLYRILANKMRVDLRFGYTSIDHEDITLGTESAPRLEVSLSSDSGAKTRVQVGLGSELRDSDLSPFSSQEHSYISGVVKHDYTKKVTLMAAGQYRTSDYSEVPAGVVGVVTPGTEDLIVFSAGLEFSIDERQKVGVHGTFEDLSSDVGVGVLRDYNRTSGTVIWRIKL